jgi:pyruvate-formate lyase
VDAKTQIKIMQHFTDSYKQYRNADKFKRELACLKQQFPAILLDPQQGDLFVGRHQLPAIGFAPQEYGTMGGLGYYINDDKIAKIRQDENLSHENNAALDKLVKFWQTEHTAYKTRAAYPEKLKNAFPSDRWTEDSAVAFPLYRLAGSMLNYKSLLTLGIKGLRDKINFCQQKNGINAFSDACAGILDLFKGVCQYYINRINLFIWDQNPYWLSHGNDIIAVLDNISENKPATLRQAIQLMFLYNTLSGSLNFGRIDDYLGVFLQNDLDNGIISESEAKSYFESLWRLMIARNTPTDGRVIVGGRGRENEAAADKIAMIAIETTMKVKNILPQLTLRFYEGQNQQLIEMALESIAQGNTFPMLYNDDINVTAVQKAFHIPLKEAEKYVPFGCGEYVIDGKSFGTPSGVINLLKALEVTIFNGHDIVTRRTTGVKTGDFEDYRSFDDFFEAYKKQVNHFIENLAEQEALEYVIAGEEAPFLFMSLLYDRCIEVGKPLLDDGVLYLGGTLETYGNTNTADSLLAIKQLVFEDKSISPSCLKDMIQNNFKGFEKERNLLLNVAKYGNNDEQADEMYLKVHHHVCETTKSMSEKIGLHSYLVVNINNSANTILGRKTAASADGRMAYTSMANGNAATPGMDQGGITSYLNSITKPEPGIHAGYVQNLKLTPDLFRNHFDKVKALLKAYFKMGGTQLMINVVNNADLIRAMDRPEEFSNLIVRVGGFSARFIDLDRDVQFEILNRTVY